MAEEEEEEEEDENKRIRPRERALGQKNFFWNFMKWGLKGEISIDADSGPPKYVLWCCWFDCYCIGQIYVGNFAKICDLSEYMNFN